MATLKNKELVVCNTSNVKEMKNGRPVNVKLAEDTAEGKLVNGIIVSIALPLENVDTVNDHVFEATPLEAEAVQAAVVAGTAYIVVAPEIMVEEARKTDGHIGLFRLEEEEVYTAYKLSVHDRIEVSTGHPMAAAGQVVSTRKMALGVVAKPGATSFAMVGVHEQPIEMKKIELGVPAFK